MANTTSPRALHEQAIGTTLLYLSFTSFSFFCLWIKWCVSAFRRSKLFLTVCFSAESCVRLQLIEGKVPLIGLKENFLQFEVKGTCHRRWHGPIRFRNEIVQPIKLVLVFGKSWPIMTTRHIYVLPYALLFIFGILICIGYCCLSPIPKFPELLECLGFTKAQLFFIKKKNDEETIKVKTSISISKLKQRQSLRLPYIQYFIFLFLNFLNFSVFWLVNLNILIFNL